MMTSILPSGWIVIAIYGDVMDVGLMVIF